MIKCKHYELKMSGEKSDGESFVRGEPSEVKKLIRKWNLDEMWNINVSQIKKYECLCNVECTAYLIFVIFITLTGFEAWKFGE